MEIYRFKEPPYDYIMKHKRVFQYNDPALRIFKKNLELAGKELSHKNIAQVHYYKNNTRKTYTNIRIPHVRKDIININLLQLLHNNARIDHKEKKKRRY